MAELINVYEEETVEFQPIVITVDGQPQTAGVYFELTKATARPQSVFADRVDVGGQIGVMVEGLAPGRWRVWCKIVSDPEIPIFKVAGQIQVGG